MSFILNALRKSEQERQTRQPENVTDRILLPQPPQNRSNTAKFIAVLFIVNVLIITGFIWFIRKDLLSAPGTTAQAVSLPLSAQETKLEPKPTPKAKPGTISIAELIEGEKPEPAPSPVIAKKPAAEPIKQPAMDSKPAQPIQATPPIAAPIKIQPDAPVTIPEKEDIPFLNDLPFEFRQTLPKFTVNVFVYSQQPEERFVMIDMVKYKAGQQIKDTMVLKEILPDSLVVVYQNKTFKIKRP
ncbi:MAG: general secretion pathway protein GspB [Methylobacter sp.]